ncbi:hypothetical protein HMPREF9123_1074 [Neisseria bacilliformis ATCC BAA-1200]|uniref:Uncharacterized protein n=1 Tax=Neisseria bacilliformis ATCC BAA-1200 TaxID=888742 RepID=F2BBG9_9NEIS|nr:hypothetical protein HMPREF9123_1074 [Neisseria bacilliformis ATCC BAA-1200]
MQTAEGRGRLKICFSDGLLPFRAGCTAAAHAVWDFGETCRLVGYGLVFQTASAV